jgi:hypothetical protein
MNEQTLLKDLQAFCSGVIRYLSAYDAVLQGLGDELTSKQSEALATRLHETRVPLLAAGETLAEAFYERDEAEPGNIINAIVRQVSSHRNGYETLRCEWPQWHFRLAQTGRKLSDSLVYQEQVLT